MRRPLAPAPLFARALVGRPGRGFVVLVGLVVWVTLDLNQPHRGVITVSQEPLQRLLEGMGK